MNIGVFDSGLGGLFILNAISEYLPQYDYYYYGDTKNLPYGDKTEEVVYEYSETAMRYLFEHDCAIVIIACNTASAQTLRKLQDTFLPNNYPDRRILGVIIPTVETVIESNSQSTLLLATKRTVESGKFQIELAARNPNISYKAVATPELVALIEKNLISEAVSVAISYIDKEAGESDTIILGCTHYGLLKEGLRAHYGPKFIFISQDEFIPEKLKLYFHNHREISSRLSEGSTRTTFLTENRSDYANFIARIQ